MAQDRSQTFLRQCAMSIDNKTQHGLSFTILNTILPTYKSYLKIDLMHIMQKSWIHVENLVSLSRSTNT